jgi:hypothetical protein
MINYQNANIAPLYQRHACVLAEQMSRFMRDGSLQTADGSREESAVSLPLVQDAPATVLTEEQAGGTIESVISIAAPSRYFDKRHGLGWLMTWKVQIGGTLFVIVDVHEHKPGYVFLQRWNGKKWLSRLAARDKCFGSEVGQMGDKPENDETSVA